MKIILIINDSPWGTTLATTALRMARGLLGSGHQLQAVFFREDGVYNSVPGTASESGIDEPASSWAEISEVHGTELMVCQSSLVRRMNQQPAAPYRVAGLVELMALVSECDRVLTF